MKPAPEAGVVNWVDEQPTTTLCISAITRAEIELGIALLPEGKRKRKIAQAAERRARVGELTSVLVTGPSRRGGTQLSGRDPYHRVVNFEPDGNPARPGSLVDVRILAATPHSLLGCPEGAGGSAAHAPAVKERAPRTDELIEIQASRP
jgi:hypothetical protein